MNKDSKHIQPILFTRVWRSVEQAAILFLRTEHDAQTAFVQLCSAVNQWVRTTDTGKKLAFYTMQNLNIDDLEGHNAFRDAELLKLMLEAGIEYVDCHLLNDEECQDYDCVLMDPLPEVSEDTDPVLHHAATAVLSN